MADNSHIEWTDATSIIDRGGRRVRLYHRSATHRPGQQLRRLMFAEGKKWCRDCRQWLPCDQVGKNGLCRYINRCRSVAPLVLIAVQDGMEARHLEPLVGPAVGIFLGGSTEWKLERMREWGEFCAERGLHYHVARVNSIKRMSAAIHAGADSIDGSSASRYAVSLPKLAYAALQKDIFAP